MKGSEGISLENIGGRSGADLAASGGMEGHPAASRVIGCAIEVHRVMGPGLLESAYESCLAHELAAAGIQFHRQVSVPLNYKGTPIDCGFRLDLLVEKDLIVEIKCVDAINPVFVAQVITYLKLTGAPQCLLLNFKSMRMVDGIKSFLRPRE